MHDCFENAEIVIRCVGTVSIGEDLRCQQHHSPPFKRSQKPQTESHCKFWIPSLVACCRICQFVISNLMTIVTCIVHQHIIRQLRLTSCMNIQCDGMKSFVVIFYSGMEQQLDANKKTKHEEEGDASKGKIENLENSVLRI